MAARNQTTPSQTPSQRTKAIKSTQQSIADASQTQSPKKGSDYIEIRLPKIRFQDTPLAPFWVILLLIFSFLLGMTTTRLQYLEKEKTATGSNAAAPQANAGAKSATKDDVKRWAKEIGLNTQKFNSCLDSEKYNENIEKDIQDAIAAKAEATPTFYINGERIVGALPYESFKEVIEKKLAQGTVGRARNTLSLINRAYAQETTPIISPTPEIFSVDKGHLPSLGNVDAPVTIVEFSDFECPFCKRYFDDTHQKIKKEYVDKGKVVLFYRHLPLSFHPMARTFASASECANEQSKFWQMHDKIFKEQG